MQNQPASKNVIGYLDRGRVWEGYVQGQVTKKVKTGFGWNALKFAGKMDRDSQIT